MNAAIIFFAITFSLPFILLLGAVRYPKATALALRRFVVILIALLFVIALVPFGVFFGVIYGVRLAHEFYTEILPSHWKAMR